MDNSLKWRLGYAESPDIAMHSTICPFLRNPKNGLLKRENYVVSLPIVFIHRELLPMDCTPLAEV